MNRTRAAFFILLAFSASLSLAAQQTSTASPQALVLIFSSSPILISQQSASAPRRDSQAIALLQASVRAMGGNVPSDSVATGSVVVVAGSLTTSGTVRILTRGTDQSSEQFQSPSTTGSVTYSRGSAAETTNGATRQLSLERSSTSQSLCFPLQFLVGALANPDESVQYIGPEPIGAQSTQHVRVRDTYASRSTLQSLANFTIYDVWVDSATGLPVRISTVRREGGGSSPGIAFDVSYSNYQTVTGILFPFTVQQSLNGTPWKTITITSVQPNTGLTDADFPVAQGAR